MRVDTGCNASQQGAATVSGGVKRAVGSKKQGKNVLGGRQASCDSAESSYTAATPFVALCGGDTCALRGAESFSSSHAISHAAEPRIPRHFLQSSHADHHAHALQGCDQQKC